MPTFILQIQVCYGSRSRVLIFCLVEEEFGEEKTPVVDCGVDAYFVDFLRDAPEATGKL